MLMQYSKIDLIKEKEKFDLYSSEFENLPLYFLNFHGATDIDSLIRTIEYAIYSYDISHVIIDNLQFLLGVRSENNLKFNKYEVQDNSISKFRKLATNENIHLTLVIHPRKSNDVTKDIQISSVFGSGKATQEADNLFILQSKGKIKLLELKKNRFMGSLNSIFFRI